MAETCSKSATIIFIFITLRGYQSRSKLVNATDAIAEQFRVHKKEHFYKICLFQFTFFFRRNPFVPSTQPPTLMMLYPPSQASVQNEVWWSCAAAVAVASCCPCSFCCCWGSKFETMQKLSKCVSFSLYPCLSIDASIPTIWFFGVDLRCTELPCSPAIVAGLPQAGIVVALKEINQPSSLSWWPLLLQLLLLVFVVACTYFVRKKSTAIRRRSEAVSPTGNEWVEGAAPLLCCMCDLNELIKMYDGLSCRYIRYARCRNTADEMRWVFLDLSLWQGKQQQQREGTNEFRCLEW